MSHNEEPAAGSAHMPAVPPPPAPAPPAAPAPAAAHAGPDAAEKLEEVMADLTKRFTMPELLAGGGALIVIAVFVLFGVLLNSFYGSDVPFIASGLILLVLVGPKMGWIDFGSSQRQLIIVLGFVMGATLVYSVLAFVRNSSFGGTGVIGEILAWIGYGSAAAGGFLSWKGRKA